MAVATNCSYGARRLSDLLKEQQEPFLIQAPQRRSPVVQACGRRLHELCAVRKRLCCVNVTDGRSGGYKTARKALLQWDLAGCFRCGARQRFRRLPRAGDNADCCDVVVSVTGLDGGDNDALDCGKQLSPVSVLEVELHSEDEESPVLSHWDDDSYDRPSTSASSPASDLDDLPGAATTPRPTIFVTTTGKIHATGVEVEGNTNKRLQSNSGAGESSLEEMERAAVSGWERIAADISRIPTLVALDLSASAREWRRHVAGDKEARWVGQSIEAMIFEEVRWEAVHDMICLREL